MSLKASKNFAKSTLATGIDSSQTNLAVASGEGSLFPDTATDGAFRFVIYNETDYPGDPASDPNAEICECTTRSTDTFSTIVRGQESTSAVAHNTSGKTYAVAHVYTAGMHQEIDARLTDQAQNYYADSGAADAYVITPSPAATAYTAGQSFRVKIANDNTGASTINVNALGTKNIIHPNGSALAAGALLAGGIYQLTYDGTAFQVATQTVEPSDIQNVTYAYAADTGAADAYAIAPTPAIASYVAGQTFTMKAANDNTGASTLNVSSLGVKTIKAQNGDDLKAKDIRSGDIYLFVYDGTYFRLVQQPEGVVAQAWVNFNGTGTVAIRDSYNVASITDNGTGDYTINFATALADANYVMVGSAANDDAGVTFAIVQQHTAAAASCRIRIYNLVAVADVARICVAFFGRR